ncbi:hypothetical protein [Rossellomorea vietnamensis]|uniref:hypothetical protein n=1 Tax=Rossellomorea vietnamensis TaxID=218284 RepID=UPI003D26A110
MVVDFRSRMLAFRGAGGEPPRHACGVSPVQQFPQESNILPLQSTFSASIFKGDTNHNDPSETTVCES